MLTRCLLACVFLAVFLYPGTCIADDLLARMAQAQAKISQLYAPFVQTRHMHLLTAPLVSEGHLCFVRADETLVWRYTSPMPLGFCLRKGKGVLFDEDPARARAATRAEEEMMRTIAAHVLSWIRVQPTTLAKTYHIERSGPNVLTLRPRRTTFFAKLRIETSEDATRLLSLCFTEANGDTLSLRFPDTRINEALPPICAQGQE